MTKLGVIGGSGLYDIEQMTDVRKERVETPFGNPSDDLILGRVVTVRSSSCRGMASATT